MARVCYFGDWAVMCGPVFAETPFNYAHKGLDIVNYGKWLKEALESTGEHQVDSIPTWEFYKMAPGEYEKVIEDYDVIIFSDVELKNFQLSPSFFDRQKFGKAPLTFPDRVRLTVDAVNSGKRMMFLGGWLSFSGEMGKGGWNRSRLSEILPVKCLDYEDLVESTEGFNLSLTENGDDFFTDIDFGSFPPILGYNKTLPRDNCTVLANVEGSSDPLVSIGDFGKGRVLAYMSDPAPHWGCNFVFWEDYSKFWLNCLDSLI